jgi:heme/copper-type cytochrome/quinol oxidase subunit 2
MVGKILFSIAVLVVLGAIVWGVIKLRDRFEILREFLQFLGERKLWWLAPILIVFALAGLFVAATSSSAVSAFIYTLF